MIQLVDNELYRKHTKARGSLPKKVINEIYIHPLAKKSRYVYGSGVNELPIDRNSQVIALAAGPNAETDCANDGGDTPGDGIVGGKSNGSDWDLTTYRTMNSDYYDLIDGGSTANLIATIQSAQTAGDILDELQAISPYLTEDAYVEAANSGLLNTDQLSHLLLINPSLAGSSDVSNALGNTMLMEEIDNLFSEAWVGLPEDPRTQMEFNLHRMGMGLMLENRETLHTVYQDTMGYALTDLTENRMYLLDPVQYYSAVFAKWKAGDEDAWNLLNNLPAMFRLSESQEEEWFAMQYYLTFLDGLNQSEKEINRLTQEEMDELIAISEMPNGGSAAGWASNALCFHYGVCREASAPKAPELIAESSPDLTESENEALSTAASYKIVPNPTSGEAVLVVIDQKIETESLTVYDVNGRQVLIKKGSNHLRFDMSSLPNGVYFCRLVAFDGSTEMVKFIVNR